LLTVFTLEKKEIKENKKMMKFEMTYHASVERIDRLTACIEYIGVGEVVKEIEKDGAVERLMDTGLLLVVNPKTNTLITGYAVTVKQVCGIYNGQRVPPALYKRVQTNAKKYAFLYKM
jgi:hypothetical protein